MKKSKILIVPLTSGDLNRLKRCIYTIENQVQPDNHEIEYDIKIVVNTKDAEYANQVKCELGDRYHVEITYSDGTPGTGKNSVFDFFRKQKEKYDYLFQIDGDDFLYPSCFTQLSKFIDQGWDIVSFQSMDWMSTNFTDKMPYAPIIENKLWIYSWCDNEINLREIEAFKYVSDADFGTGGRIFTPGTSMFLGKNFLNHFPNTKHTNKIKLFEDYLFFLKLFHHHLKGDIKMCHTNNSYMYVYDKANETSISTHNCFYGQKELDILKGYCKQNDMMDKHPKKDLEFIRLGPVDFFEMPDKILWIKHVIEKFPVKLNSLDVGKQKQKQSVQYKALQMMLDRPIHNLNGNFGKGF